MKNKKFAQLQRGVIVEFDFAVLDGSAALLTACNKSLSQYGLKLDAPLMAHLMNGKTVGTGFKAVAKYFGKTIDAEAAVVKFNEVFEAELKSMAAKNKLANFAAFVTEAKAQGLRVVLITRLEAEDALVQLEGETETKPRVFQDTSISFGGVPLESWRRASRKNDMHERICVAITGGGLSTRNTLKLGMNIVAKLSEGNAYQDFSGSNLYVEDYKPELVSEIKALLNI